MATQIKLRRDTYQNWYDNNPLLSQGEPGYDLTNKRLKIGDGVTLWRSLAYFDVQQTDLSAYEGDIIPSTDNTYNIGCPDNRWQHGFFADGSLYVGNIKLSSANNTLVVQPVINGGLESEVPVPNTPGAVTSSSLVNNGNEVVLEADGSITFPTKTFKNWNDVNETGPTLQLGNDPASQVLITGPTPNNTYWDAQRIVIQGQQGYGGENNDKGEGGDVYIWAGSGGDPGSLQPRGDGGDVKLRGGLGGNEGGYIRIESGDAQAASGTGGFLDLNAGNAGATGGTGGNVNINAGGGNAFGGNVNINAGQGDNNTGGTVNISAGYGSVTGGNVEIVAGGGGTTNGNVEINAGNGGWAFKQDGSFSLSFGEVHIATNNWGTTVGGGTGATGVVYTAKNQDLASIRVHATIEGYEDGDSTGYHSQACDVMIVRRVAIGGAVTVDAVVYGVIYTGAAPLATLDAQWNAVSSRIEITATPTSTTNDVFVKVYATEVARGD